MMEVECNAVFHYRVCLTSQQVVTVSICTQEVTRLHFSWIIGHPDCEYTVFSCKILIYTPFMTVFTFHLSLYNLYT
jgi:hypothetical protein